jgi:hypothetical protein
MDLRTLSSEALPATPTHSPRRRHAGRLIAGALGAATIGIGTLGAQGARATTNQLPDASANYAFQTLDNSSDPTFNQLLGINNNGRIAGYFGSGMAGHPNQGYVLHNGQYGAENFPGAAQTQVIGINDDHITVGFYIDATGNNSGFYAFHQRGFRTVDFPTHNQSSPKVDQLLGVNDHGVAVGFYTDHAGVNHGYSYNIATGHYGRVNVRGLTNVTAAGINNLGDISGFGTNSSGTTVGYLLLPNGKRFEFAVPGATMTQAFGVNDGDEVVGTYTDGSGTSATTFGFVWAPGLGFSTISDPNGVGATTLNGINDRGDVVGFYTDSQGNTDGLAAAPTM